MMNRFLSEQAKELKKYCTYFDELCLLFTLLPSVSFAFSAVSMIRESSTRKQIRFVGV